MTDKNENPSFEDRFEMLKSLLKHQIKANEVLKFELAQLSKLYQKVCKEKSLLLNELLDNHSSCIKVGTNSEGSSEVDHSVGITKENSLLNVQKHSLIGDIKPNTKRPRIAQQSAKLSPREDSAAHTLTSESTFSQESEPWHQQEELDDMLPSIVRQRGPNLGSPPCTTTNVRNPGSRLQTLATQLNSSFGASGATDPPKPSPWQYQLNNSCSPPTLTVSSNMGPTQRSTKGASLVTSSSLASAKAPVSVVQHVRSSSRFLSPTGRNITTGLLSTSTLPKSVASGNLIISATTATGTTTVVACGAQKPSQGAPAYRLSCSSTGQRILIQPSEHGRQIRIQQPDNRISSSVSEDFH